jgi:hypothetical protein
MWAVELFQIDQAATNRVAQWRGIQHSDIAAGIEKRHAKRSIDGRSANEELVLVLWSEVMVDVLVR